MLNDELILMKSWAASGVFITPEAAGGEICPIITECVRIRKVWLESAFSPVTDDCLKRYYQHHFLGLAEIGRQADRYPEVCFSRQVLALIDDLREHYGVYLDDDIMAPVIYQGQFAKKNAMTKKALAKRIAAAEISPRLKSCLAGYMKEMAVEDFAKRFTFRSLRYFEHWLCRLNELSPQDATGEEELNTALESLDFNDLAYFNYRQKLIAANMLQITDRTGYLHAEKCRLLTLSFTRYFSCRPEWPSLSFMLCGWITEEMAFLTAPNSLNAAEVYTPPVKYPLSLSVAHIGCLLHLFCGTEVPGNRNLTQLFDFVTTHFSAKKQEQISAHSLSNAYYGTTQVTAAKVQGMLQQMISRLNRKYFP